MKPQVNWSMSRYRSSRFAHRSSNRRNRFSQLWIRSPPALGTRAVLPLALPLIASAKNDRLEAGDMNDAPHFIAFVAQIETRVALAAADRASTHQVSRRGNNQLHVMPIGWRDLNGKPYTCGSSEQAALDEAFAVTARVATCSFPPNGTLVIVPSSAS